MGRQMAYEADFHRPASSEGFSHRPTPQLYLTQSAPPNRLPPNSSRSLVSWLALQSPSTRAAITRSDPIHFEIHGFFQPRALSLSTPVTLRLELHSPATAHLPPEIHRPHIDIHPLTVQTLGMLLAVLRRQYPTIDLDRTSLQVDEYNGFSMMPNTEMAMPLADRATEDVYQTWWTGSFVYGRQALVCVKVLAR